MNRRHASDIQRGREQPPRRSAELEPIMAPGSRNAAEDVRHRINAGGHVQRRFSLAWLAACLLAVPAAAVSSEPSDVPVLSVRGVIQPMREITLRSPFDARVADVQVVVGQTVAAGELLVQLDSAPLERSLAQATAGTQQAAAERALADRGLDRIDQAEQRLRTDLGIARNLLDRPGLAAGPPGRRHRDGPRKSIMRAPLQELADERTGTVEAEARKALLQARMRRSLVEPFRDELRSVEAEARVAEKTAEELLERYAGLTSPSAATVASCPVRPQERVSKGRPVVSLVDTKRVKVLLWIPGERISEVRKGAPVSVRPKGAKRGPYPGEISRISIQPHPRTGQYLAEVVLENGDGRLRPGTLVDATIGPVPASASAASPGADRGATD